MRVVLAILATVLGAAAAQAADPDGRYQLLGAGTVTCQAYTNATEEQRVYAATWWAGYITAMNRATPDTYHLMGETPPEQVNEMLRKYCGDNPNDRFAIAVHKVVEQLYPKRTRKKPS